MDDGWPQEQIDENQEKRYLDLFGRLARLKKAHMEWSQNNYAVPEDGLKLLGDALSMASSAHTFALLSGHADAANNAFTWRKYFEPLFVDELTT